MNKVRFQHTVNANLQNKINKSIVFHYLREHGATFRARIAKELSLSPPAVSRAVENLIQEGYVVETEKIVTESGKRPTQLRLNTEKGIVVAVDLIKDTIEVATSDFGGRLLQKSHGFHISRDTDIDASLINEIWKALSVFADSRGSSEIAPRLQAIAVGVPAITDRESGTIVGAPLYGNLLGTDFKKKLEDTFRVPVYVENVVRLSALGEKSVGYGREYDSLVFIEVSNGIGAGIIVENRLLRGRLGGAGEIGFCAVGKEGLNFKAESKGYLESQASVESIGQKAMAAIRSGRHSVLGEAANGESSMIDPATVCRAAAEGDSLSREIVGEIVQLLSIVVVNVVLLLNPGLIVFGGDICNLPHVDSLFVDPIRSAVTAFLPFQAPNIVLSSLGEDAGVIGAAFFAIESLLVNEFPYSLDFGR